MNNDVKSGDMAAENLPLVSILIVNYNGQAHLKEFFESVYKLNYPADRYEVVMVDNASTDGSPEWVEENYPGVKLVRLERNYGFAGGNNIGVTKHCQGKFIALINNDTVLDKDWLIELVMAAVKDPDAIYGSKMLWYSNKDYIVYGGGRLFAWGESCHLQTYSRDNPLDTGPLLTMYADGCGAMISRDLFLKVGGFETSYFCYCEDIELNWKVWLSGHKAYFVPSARFYHKVSSTWGRNSKSLVYYMVRNQLRNLIKFPELPTLLIFLPLFSAYYMALYIVVFCFQEKAITLIWPILRAHLEVISELPVLIRKRRIIQRNRKIRDRELRALGLIFSFRDSVRESFSIMNRRSKFWREAHA